MPDRLPSLIYLVGCWVPPAVIGMAAAHFVQQSRTHIPAAMVYAGLTMVVMAWAATWFVFQLNRIPPYVPGATMDPTYAPPEAVTGLAVVAAALVLPVSLVACIFAFRRRVRTLN